MVLVQLTDLHLGQISWSDERTNADRLRSVIRRIHSKIKPDYVLITGDLVEAASPAERKENYRELRKQLDVLTMPWRLVPGNHDDKRMLGEFFPRCSVVNRSRLHPLISADERFVFIGSDTVFPGRIAGGLDETRLSWLKRQVQRRTAKSVVLFMHHAPIELADIPTNIPRGLYAAIERHLTDKGIFEGIPEFYELMESCSSVRHVMAGHTHVGFHGIRQGIPITISPGIAPPSRYLTEYRRESLPAGRLVVDARPGFTVFRTNKGGHLEHAFVFVD